MSRFKNRVKETATGTGTANFSLTGAAAGYRTFASQFAIGTPFKALLTDDSNFEICQATLSNASTLVRGTVENSSAGDGYVDWTAGTKNVTVILTNSDIDDLGVITHVWRANGPYQVDDKIDGVFIPKFNFTLGSVVFHRETSGTGGTSTFDIRLDGTSVLSTLGSVAAASGNNVTVTNAVISTASIPAAGKLTLHCTTKETGVPDTFSATIYGLV